MTGAIRTSKVEELAQSEDLAYDVALQYFSDDVIAFRHQITVGELARIKSEPGFVALIFDQQKKIAADGEQFRLKAAAHADKILEEMAAIAVDPDVAHSNRVKAAELVGRWAGRDVRDGGAGAGQMQVVLTTNLSLGAIERVETYEIEVQPDASDLV